MNSIPRIKPRRLKAGATLGVLAPASPGAAEFASAGVQYLTAQGFQIRLGKSVNQEEGYLSGTDALRAADINNMFADPAIDGIICLRGGYGTMRLLELLNYELIKKTPRFSWDIATLPPCTPVSANVPVLLPSTGLWLPPIWAKTSQTTRRIISGEPSRSPGR